MAITQNGQTDEPSEAKSGSEPQKPLNDQQSGQDLSGESSEIQANQTGIKNGEPKPNSEP